MKTARKQRFLPRKKTIIGKDGEIRELTKEDMRLFRPAEEVLPKELYDGLVAMQVRRRGKQKAPTKTAISIRLSEEVLSHFRKTGMGWQTRIDDVLKEWVKQQEAA